MWCAMPLATIFDGIALLVQSRISLVPRVSILPNLLLYKEYLEFHPFAFKELLSRFKELLSLLKDYCPSGWCRIDNTLVAIGVRRDDTVLKNCCPFCCVSKSIASTMFRCNGCRGWVVLHVYTKDSQDL